MTRRSRTGALVAAGALGLGAAIAIASVPDSNGITHACVHTDAASGLPAPSPNVRVIDSDSQNCTNGSEKAVTLGGQPGPPGIQGPPGPPGTSTINDESPVGQVTINGGSRARSLPISGVTTFPFLTISLDVTGPGSRSAGYGTARVPAPGVTVTRQYDKLSPNLMNACATGEHFKKMVFQLFKGGTTTPYLTYTLTDAIITSVHQKLGHATAVPEETLQIAEAKLTTQYAPGATHTLPAIQYSSSAKTKLKFPG